MALTDISYNSNFWDVIHEITAGSLNNPKDISFTSHVFEWELPLAGPVTRDLTFQGKNFAFETPLPHAEVRVITIN